MENVETLFGTFAASIDDFYTVMSQYSNFEGLAPENKSLYAENTVVAIAPDVTDSYFTWRFVRRDITHDKKSLIATVELHQSGLFLSYDSETNKVVIKKDSQPAWILTRYSGGHTQFKIASLTSPKTYLTYAGQGAQVTVTAELTNTDDILKQVWNIETSMSKY